MLPKEKRSNITFRSSSFLALFGFSLPSLLKELEQGKTENDIFENDKLTFFKAKDLRQNKYNNLNREII